MITVRCTLSSLPQIAQRSTLSAVPADLLADVLLLGAQHPDLLLDGPVVPLQQFDALGERARPGPAQLGVAQHLRDRHAGVAQAAQNLEPAEVVVGERASPARRAGDAVEQPDAFVIAQRVEAEPRLVGDLSR